MSDNDMRVSVYVTYVGVPSDRFDRAYYEETHLSLVMRAWEKYGLLGASAFFPSVGHAGTLAICECVFRDEAAIQAAFTSEEAASVMADVVMFTDLSPARVRVAPL
ncbi:EthD family reductase [Luteibacter aegosomatis]|uniref:EthD family reductase n=1 Tax=Luteibacter aegosomatis TaxID=2911537 RepID=UPI001FF79900|nr:EthD family reductase [Luteibacter aegosomatis]UPG87957.1 EthD family reductase [Luteibacter aegosomatis]